MVLTDGKETDIRVAESKLSPPPDSIVVCDRGYECKRWFKSLGWTNRPFVCRAKKSTHYFVETEFPIEDEQKVLSDNQVVLCLSDLRNNRAKRFRRIVLPPFPGHKNPIILITNIFDRTALEIGEIYHTRWEIEKFFKWIKQHLSTTVFLGTSQNAIKTFPGHYCQHFKYQVSTRPFCYTCGVYYRY